MGLFQQPASGRRAVAGNFAGLLDASARTHAGRPAIVGSGGALSHAALHRRAAGFARFLGDAVVCPGDPVALSIPNGWRFAAALLGALRLGAVVAPLDPRLTEDERRAILDDLRPRLVAHEVDADEAEWPSVTESDAGALVLYTSGSTGRPKGAVLSHAALGFAVESWAGPVMALTPDDVVLGVLPFSHSYGLNGALLAPLLTGGSVVALERFAPDEVLEAVAAHRVTVLPAVATMFRRLLGSPALDRARLGSVRMALSGAAPCPWDLACEWRARTGVRIFRGYGSTELFRPLSYLAADADDRPDAIGRPVPGVEVRVTDDDGRAVPPGELGELLIRTPAAMDGYLGAPDETREVLVDGWFHTGDLARVTREGWVTIEGRKRERILRGGYSVFPQEVEAVLLGHPAVGEAAVVGVPHDELGEEVAAFVALRDGERAAPDELIAHCKRQLAAFKYPRRITIVAELPKAPTGKILKKLLTS
jgi:long-chain acyl-CoA synthetase